MRKWLTIIAAGAAVLSAVGYPLGGLPRAQAHASHDLPSPYAFALPPSTFPPDSVVRGSRATERTLEAASGLHTDSLARSEHLLGYLQTGWWWPSTRTHGQRALASIQYMASIFGSPDQADAAYGNAQASLWELGYPMKGKVANNHPFAVIRSDGSAEAYLLLHRGPIELECRLHYDQSIDRPSPAPRSWPAPSFQTASSASRESESLSEAHQRR